MKYRINLAFRNRYILIIDLAMIGIATLGSYVLRLELSPFFSVYLNSAYYMIAASLIIKPLVYFNFGLYRRLWAYASMQELKLIVVAVTTASILLSLVMVSFFSMGFFIGFPRSVLIIDWLLSVLMVGGVRFAVRLILETKTAPRNSMLSKQRNVLIVGAGDAGALVVRELQKNPQLNLCPVGFLDDSSNKQNQHIYGVRIVGTLTNLSEVLDKQQVDEVIIAIPSAPGKVVRLVADICRLKGISFRTMPGIYELLGGKVSVNRLREVDIADLLRREPTKIQDEKVRDVIGGRIVMVTGAGGSIGKELCRQIARWNPTELILVGHGENSIFEAVLDLQDDFPLTNMIPVIVDLRDKDRLRYIFERFNPQVIFHAAAHKHVPLMEMNPEEAVTNNILGTRNIVETAVANHIERIVLISTDKAIRPINIMGASKRIAEMIVLDAAVRSGSAFSVVRFGNVLGSRGSVVPLFKRQIAQGGPVTITHPDMRRYFMTIPEAVHLVLQAASMGSGGEAFVLNMGQQIRILDLAEDLIRLSGLEPGKDIEIVFTGIRPGEKLKEDLWDDSQLLQPTSHPEIFRLDGQEEMRGATLQNAINELVRLASEGDHEAIGNLFDELIPGSAVRSASLPKITEID
jgi:FlaA1/EpsC-like NDP-sugar epimerase